MGLVGRAAVIATMLAAVSAMSGCRTSGLIFVQDDALVVNSPSNLAVVGQPVRISWRTKTTSPSYAVFIDSTPMDVGQPLDLSPGPTRVLQTSETTIKLGHLTPGPGTTDAERNHHQVSVVMLDSHGIRQGEQAGSVEFTVR